MAGTGMMKALLMHNIVNLLFKNAGNYSSDCCNEYRVKK